MPTNQLSRWSGTSSPAFVILSEKVLKAQEVVKTFAWNEAKNQRLKSERGVSFEEVIVHIAAGNVLDIVEHPNPERYKRQRVFIVKMHDYAWLVTFVESENEIFLKTIIPSRKATRKYLGI